MLRYKYLTSKRKEYMEVSKMEVQHLMKRIEGLETEMFTVKEDNRAMREMIDKLATGLQAQADLDRSIADVLTTLYNNKQL